MRLTGLGVIAAALLFSSVAQAELAISVDKSTQLMKVRIDGAQKYVWPVSTGRSGHATPAGDFKPFRMEIDHKSKEWDDAPMPHSVFFTRQGHAIHGSFDTKKLGTPASAGCVRLAPANAALLFSLVTKHGLNATKVTIDGDERLIARRGGPAARLAAAQPQPQQPAPNQGVSLWPNPFAPFAGQRPEPVAAPAPEAQRFNRNERRAQAQPRPQPRETAYYYDERLPRRAYAEDPYYYGGQPARAPARAYPNYR